MAQKRQPHRPWLHSVCLPFLLSLDAASTVRCPPCNIPYTALIPRPELPPPTTPAARCRPSGVAFSSQDTSPSDRNHTALHVAFGGRSPMMELMRVRRNWRGR